MYLNIDIFGLVGLHQNEDCWVVAVPNERYPSRRALVAPHHPFLLIPEDLVESCELNENFWYECSSSDERYLVIDISNQRFSIDMTGGNPGNDDFCHLISITNIIDGGCFDPCHDVADAHIPLGNRLKSRGELRGGAMTVLSYNVLELDGEPRDLFTFNSTNGTSSGPCLVPDAMRYRSAFDSGSELNVHLLDPQNNCVVGQIVLKTDVDDKSIYVSHTPIIQLKSENHMHALFELMTLRDESPDTGQRMLPLPYENSGIERPSIEEVVSNCIQELYLVTFGIALPSNRLSCPLVQLP